MDLVFETIKKAIKSLYGNQIDYSKTYRMSCVAFNPLTQSITGQAFDSTFNLIVEAPLFGLGIWFTTILPGTEYLLTFESADPGKPIAHGLRFLTPGQVGIYPTSPTPGSPILDGMTITIKQGA